MRAILRIAAATVAVTVAVVAILLATDLLLWRGTLRSSDTRFASGSTASSLWKPTGILPLGAGRRVLGLDDDLAYRLAFRAFVISRPRDQPFSDTDILGRRGQARDLLEGIAEGSGDRARRSAASNLVGVLAFANAALDPDQAYSSLGEAVADFRTAIALDPGNADAKYNLELGLARLKATKRPRSQQDPRGSRGGAGAGAGTGEPGSGY